MAEQARLTLVESHAPWAHARAVRAETSGHSIAQLAAEWVAASDQAEAEFQRLVTAQNAARAIYPEFPAACMGRIHDTGALFKLSRAELERQAENDLFGTGKAWRATLEAYDRWEAQCAAIDSSFGVPGLEEASERAFRVVSSLAKRIETMTPATAAEAALKFGVILKNRSDGRGGIDEAGPIFAFLADLEHLAARESRH